MQDSKEPLATAEVYLSYGRKSQAEKALEDAIKKEPDRIDFQNKLIEIRSSKAIISRKKMSKSDLKLLMTFFGGDALLIWGMVEGPKILNPTPLIVTALTVGLMLAVLVGLVLNRSMQEGSGKANKIAALLICLVGIVAGTVGLIIVTNNHILRSEPVPASFSILGKSTGPSKHGLNYYLTIDDDGRSEVIQIPWLHWNKYFPGDHFEINVSVGLWGYRIIPAIRDR